MVSYQIINIEKINLNLNFIYNLIYNIFNNSLFELNN
jgi:hypothetical protein